LPRAQIALEQGLFLGKQLRLAPGDLGFGVVRRGQARQELRLAPHEEGREERPAQPLEPGQGDQEAGEPRRPGHEATRGAPAAAPEVEQQIALLDRRRDTEDRSRLQ